MIEEGEPATVIYGRIYPKVLHGQLVRRQTYLVGGWIFTSSTNGELFLRDEEEGTGWSRGHHDGKDLLAACLPLWSAP